MALEAAGLSEASSARPARRPAGTALLTVLSLAGLVALWAVAASLADSRVLASPAAVLAAGWADTVTGELPFNLAMTLGRVAGAFVIAMVAGTAIGLAMGLRPRLNRFFDPWLILILNVPALVVIVLAYIWFGLNEAAAIGAIAVNKIPNVVVTMREGARALDPQLAEMARVYRFSALDRLRHLILPQLQPYLAAAARSGLSLIWKIALVVELLGRSNGVGFQIHLYFQLFDVAAILAYTLAFVAVMLLIEFLLVQPLEARATRWRRRPA
ncbi:ABC transporter permease [Antarcticirhabdus aurantiaca]|uniref:ABC transporter permease n=1 Tax=Antarcticirhabdus aurantiaca TaxID=2606717 RepID=A0ACD4NUL0_9HYPH|nr:ABC transporter permease [Antarcticirhabdus aurantiaca]WAJ30438.1 ABC transporter permease [Jeongeuplla avenae]